MAVGIRGGVGEESKTRKELGGGGWERIRQEKSWGVGVGENKIKKQLGGERIRKEIGGGGGGRE